MNANPANLDARADAELLAAARDGGDDQAFAALVERYREPLFAFLRRNARSDADAEEGFQETWFRAIRSIGRFRQRHFAAWLFRIARNWLIDESRRRKPDLSLDAPAAAPGGDAVGTFGDRISDAAPAPDAAASRRDLAERIRRCADALPAPQREVFWLRMDAGLEFRDIAIVQRCSVNTALARMQYALAKLRKALAGDWQEYTGGLP